MGHTIPPQAGLALNWTQEAEIPYIQILKHRQNLNIIEREEPITCEAEQRSVEHLK
jgi:hypothetical protein